MYLERRSKDKAVQNRMMNGTAECATQAAAIPTSASTRRYSIATCARNQNCQKGLFCFSKRRRRAAACLFCIPASHCEMIAPLGSISLTQHFSAVNQEISVIYCCYRNIK